MGTSLVRHHNETTRDAGGTIVLSYKIENDNPTFLKVLRQKIPQKAGFLFDPFMYS
jgi:hypothetical protein